MCQFHHEAVVSRGMPQRFEQVDTLRNFLISRQRLKSRSEHIEFTTPQLVISRLISKMWRKARVGVPDFFGLLWKAKRFEFAFVADRCRVRTMLVPAAMVYVVMGIDHVSDLRRTHPQQVELTGDRL